MINSCCTAADLQNIKGSNFWSITPFWCADSSFWWNIIRLQWAPLNLHPPQQCRCLGKGLPLDTKKQISSNEEIKLEYANLQVHIVSYNVAYYAWAQVLPRFVAQSRPFRAQSRWTTSGREGDKWTTMAFLLCTNVRPAAEGVIHDLLRCIVNLLLTQRKSTSLSGLGR